MREVRSPRRIDVLGGGPGGLYLAVLLKQSAPGVAVRVFEREHPSETFGFGVGFTARTLERLGGADTDTHGALVAAALPVDRGEFRLPGGSVAVRSAGGVTIERARLLALLHERAERVGVVLEMGRRTTLGDLDADLVVAADGATSGARQQLASELDVQVDRGRGRFLWCGVDVRLPSAVYQAAETPDGTFVVHAYPYRHDRSTVLIECDDRTWERSGMAARDAATSEGESDQASLSVLEQVFADLLEGRPLLGNRTRWRQFVTVRCGRWSAGRVVALGDAAHTAHFSVGSGTKLAMEDAIALAGAIAAECDLHHALDRYERERRPEVERVQMLAEHSRRWWDAFPSRLELAPARVAVSFLTRTGAIALSSIDQRDPGLVRAALDAHAGRGASVDEVVAEAVRPAGTSPASVLQLPAGFGDEDGPEADELVEHVDGAPSVLVRRGHQTDEVAALAFCERLRLRHGRTVLWESRPGEQDSIGAALLAGRIDATVPVLADADAPVETAKGETWSTS